MKTSFKTGAIALAFLVLGFELAFFINRAARSRIVANRDRPDTVYVFSGQLPSGVSSPTAAQPAGAGCSAPPVACDGPLPLSRGWRRSCEDTPEGNVVRIQSQHSQRAKSIYESTPGRRVENFRFNPNTVSLEDLCRLGFTEKQAQAIINYRTKGGRFRRKGDFAKSFVVSDSVFRRLEPFIVIPKIDINKADSAAFDSLPGIGGWFAHRMVEYRGQLRGYSCPEQLMEIWNFDRQKYDGLKDLICCSPAEPYPFWSGTLDDIRSHPHIRNWQTAKDIAFYRDHNPPETHTPEGLLAAGIITGEQAEKLSRCSLK